MKIFFADNLRLLLSARKMTYADLAEMLGVTLQSVGRWANGINEPNLETLLKIAKIFNVSLDSLIRKNLADDLGHDN